MKLSRLEIYGFKSFAKKLDLKLGNGITAIVGPNGCGKTNVVDSIRWVLGEQRPTQIRLDRMEDVLFKGSTTRHQLGMSEVSLTIENVTGILSIDLPEITLTRRLFRSGESDYLMNKKPCRLADINDLLMDTGMGTDSYSVFELSMINSILSDKTDDRRHIFEEAAGVTKYKARRKSALNKLISIQDDLDRVGDIINELRRRVDSLKRQASKAKRYRSLKSDVKSKSIALAAFEMAQHKKKTAEVNRELADVRTKLESFRVAISRATAETERLSTDMVTIEKKLEETAVSYNASISTISEKEKEQARLDSRLEFLDKIAARAREAAQRDAAAREKLAVTHGDCAGNLSEVTRRMEDVESAFSEAEKRYRELMIRTAEKKDTYASLEKEYHRIEHEITYQKAALGHVSEKREENKKRLKEISSRVEELKPSLACLESDLEKFTEQKLNWLYEERRITEKISEMRSSYNACQENLDALDRRLRDALEKQAGIKAERDFLSEVIRSFQGYSEGVKNAVRAESLEGRVLGVLGDIVSTDERYLPAVEAALRESLQAVLVENIETAAAGARYLSEGKRGRATFLPADSAANVPDSGDLPDAPGVVGHAHTFVRAEARFEPVVKRLLTGVLIVDSLETALDLRKRNGGARYVTLDGELVGTFGDVHGGSVNDSRGETIGRAEKLKKIEASFEESGKETQNLQKERDELSVRSIMLRGIIDELENTLEEERKKHSEQSSSEAGTRAKKEAAEEMLKTLAAEADAIESSFAVLESEADVTTDTIATKDRHFQSLRERLEKTGSEVKNLTTELESRRSAVNDLQVEQAALMEKKASLGRELEAIGERRESLAQSSSRSLDEIEKAEREILEVGKMKQTIIEELETLEQKHEQLKNKKDGIEHRYTELRSKRSEQEHKLQEHRRDLDETSRKESALVLSLDEAVMVINNIKTRLEEEYYVDPGDIPDVTADRDFDPENEKLLLEDLRRKIHLLGDVNLAAETDYDEEKKRLDFLEHERDDLIDAGNTLRETITKINKIARTRFLETFDRIRNNFQKMFQEFFDGGVCDISLEEDADPLEAAIHIAARPPGKNVRAINMLSSGERALTAISMLFAIYLVKPSPFCILDEVDAPLDDANIDRYLRVIKEFSQKTQFIMVTHNKKTMAAATNLYGITMEEPGLSTLVSVRLSEVDSGGNGRGGQPEKEEAVAV